LVGCSSSIKLGNLSKNLHHFHYIKMWCTHQIARDIHVFHYNNGKDGFDVMKFHNWIKRIFIIQSLLCETLCHKFHFKMNNIFICSKLDFVNPLGMYNFFFPLLDPRVSMCCFQPKNHTLLAWLESIPCV
jgi:hypothetical protein